MMEEKTEKKKLPRGARFISEIRIHPFSLFIITTSHHSNRTIKLSHIFLLVFLPPLYFPFSTFVSFSLSLSLILSLSTKGDTVTQGKIDSNISEIVIRSRSSHCSEIDGRVYVFAWVEGRERIHRE